jgi:thiol-disulfide isomerase/thioredoxin
MQFSSLYKISIFFFLFTLGLYQVFSKNLAFANSDVIHVDKSAPVNQELIDEIFDNLYEEPYLQPNIEIFDYNNAPFTLKDFRGNFVILYFWATWCNSCVQEMQSFAKMLEQLEFQDVKDVIIIPVSIDFKSNQQLADFYKINKLLKLRMFKDQNKQLMGAMNVTSVPTIFFINKEGYVIQGFEQSLKWQEPYLIKKLLSIKGPYVKPPVLPNIAITKPEEKKEGDTAAQNTIIPEKPKKKTPMIIN